MRVFPALRYASQPDVLEWAASNQQTLADMRKAKESAKESLFSIKKYFSSEKSPKSETPEPASENNAAAEPPKEEPKLGESLMQQYYQSQELRNVLKWKRITWDANVDYDGLSNRLIESVNLLRKQQAFSFLGVHFIRDKATQRVNEACGLADESTAPLPMHEITHGTISSWYTRESEPKSAPQKPAQKPEYARPAPFRVCWETGKVHMLDSVAPEEILYFLKNFAHRAQQTQLRIEDEQTRLNEAVENVRFRCTLDSLKFNEEDQAFREATSADREKRTVLSPQEVLQFCDSMLKTAWLYRSVLRGQQVRVGLSGSSYSVDASKGEVRIPCDFDRHSWMPKHDTYLRHEAIANSYRNHWYVWLFAATFLIGDLDVI